MPPTVEQLEVMQRFRHRNPRTLWEDAIIALDDQRVAALGLLLEIKAHQEKNGLTMAWREDTVGFLDRIADVVGG